METSLRYSGQSKSLRIHAKEKFPVDSLTFLQVHGELDTSYGGPSYCSAILRHFYPDLQASLGLGVQFDRRDKLRYTVRGKKAFPLTSNGRVSFNITGRCDADKDFKEVCVHTAITLFSTAIIYCCSSSSGDRAIYPPTKKRVGKFQEKRKSNGAAEFVWSIFNFQKDQDVRFKVGYDMIDKVPYMQVRENNWTLNADAKGRWSIRYDL